MIRKLSCDWPNTEPFALATPTTSNGTPSAVMVCPMGLTPAKNLSLRSCPMNATFMWRSFSISERKRPSSASRLVITPIFGDAPCKPTPSEISVPRCTVTPRPAVMPISLVMVRRSRRNSYSSRLKLGIAPQHFHVLLGVEAHHHDALHAVSVGAHAGDILRDVDVHARDHATSRRSAWWSPE